MFRPYAHARGAIRIAVRILLLGFAVGGLATASAPPAHAQLSVATCKGPLEPSVPGGCLSVGAQGCCDSVGRVLYCEGGDLFCIDCASTAPQCGWWPNPGYYDCNALGPELADPSGNLPISCGCPGCGPTSKCSEQCPGSCGQCEGAGEICLPGGSCWVPDCAGKTCGTDSKGISCGHCAAGSECDDSVGVCYPLPEPCVAQEAPGCAGCACEACVCAKYPNCCENDWDTFCAAACELECGFDCSPCPAAPTCDGKSCGTYCGLDCGTCPASDTCYGFACCSPQCDGKSCGGDGCGGTCGTCAAGETECHEASGQCVEIIAGCDATTAAGCDGCPCEACVCALDPTCCSIQWDGGCAAACESDCGGCDPCAIEPGCDGKSCGTWCGNDCGICEVGERCFDFNCCSPQCDGKSCGDDGCGGTCGVCPKGTECDGAGGCESLGCGLSAGGGCSGCPCEATVCAKDPYCCEGAWDAKCVALCAEEGEGCTDLPEDPCASEPAEGCCFGNTRRFCEDGHLKVQACPTGAPCGWNPADEAYTCGTSGLGHPGLKVPKACGDCPEACAIPKCSPECFETCGTCPEGSACRADGVCVAAGTGCDEGVIFEGRCVSDTRVEYCQEDTAETLNQDCEGGQRCDWDPVDARYTCRDTPEGSCTNACETDETGCAANGTWKYSCSFDLATNCKIRKFVKCAQGAVCIDGDCPEQVDCTDDCEAGDQGCLCAPGDIGCTSKDRWACEKDVDGCWFKAQKTCPFGCAEGGDCLEEAGPCGLTTYEGRCDVNTASWCAVATVEQDACGGGARCFFETFARLNRCFIASASPVCLTLECAPK